MKNSKELATCGNCDCQKMLHPLTIKRSQNKNNGQYICGSCKAKTAIKPQCSPAYWNEKRKSAQSEAVKSSEKYYAALQQRKVLSGVQNPMYGKQHSAATKKKMSEVRKGKLGPNATAWKGGKLSITRRVKGIIHTRYNWYKKVYERDSFCCQQCGSKKKLDAHHIEPIYKIIKMLLATCNLCFETNEDKIEWLANQPKIIDSELKNGITLCRKCHKQEHGKKWGSHEC